MPKLKIRFVYMTGLRRNLFRHVRLSGSWDGEGRYSSNWSTVPMQAFKAEDGCPAYAATVELDDTQKGSAFQWGVLLDGPAGRNLSGILTEVSDPRSRERYRTFILAQDGQQGSLFSSINLTCTASPGTMAACATARTSTAADRLAGVRWSPKASRTTAAVTIWMAR
jgi:hypothetical protein